MRNFAVKLVKNNHNTVYFQKFFPRKWDRLWDNVEKHGRVKTCHRWSMEYAHCMLDNKGYRHTLRICNTCCFFTSKVVTRAHLNTTLHVHCLHCLL